MLYLVATPIGNLSDMTFRAIEILKSVDYILCEDTRQSSVLLKHYNIHQPLKSYHKFNEASREESILEDLQAGKTIAIISDAGTPGISDPGSSIVLACVNRGIRVIPIPGACSAIAALSCSGLPTERFQFIGFLPRKEGALKHTLQETLTYPGTTICYESPLRLRKVLLCLHELAPEKIIAVGRELTKKFEEMRRGKPQELIDHWKNHPLKGEIVLLISGKTQSSNQTWENLSPIDHVKMIQAEYGLSKNEAIKLVAEMRQVPKREIYNKVVS